MAALAVAVVLALLWSVERGSTLLDVSMQKAIVAEQTSPVSTAKSAINTNPVVVGKPSPKKIEPIFVNNGDLTVTFPEPTPLSIDVAAPPSFVKLGANQAQLDPASEDWPCVMDRNTGLVWENKTDDRGLRDARNFYSWYDPDAASNGGYAGIPNNGKCRGGIACDTNAYIGAVNRMKLCGYADWRLPTRAELITLVQYNTQKKTKGLIDEQYFPGASSDWYWAADSDVTDPKYAWYVLYLNGSTLKAEKTEAKRVRLVRGGIQRSLADTKEPRVNDGTMQFAGAPDNGATRE